MKVLMIMVDGMRPDAIAQVPYAQRMIAESASAMDAVTVFPSVTLPCHMSLFHSVDPARHGTTTNTYAPQVRPVNGLCEVLAKEKKTCAIFYNWAELRDLALPGNVAFSYMVAGKQYTYERANRAVTDAAISFLQENPADFTFLYLGWTDHAGHRNGWMSEEYMRAIHCSWDEIQRVVESLPEDYTVIVTADHGGHDRTHGTTQPEDMTIPLILRGKDFAPGSIIGNASIKDIAPTIVELLGVQPDEEWEGRSLL